MTGLDGYSNPDNDLFASVISYWEISLKYAIGKLELEGITPAEIPEISKTVGIEALNISAAEASTFYRPPKLKHKDPFDRLIVWQAISRKIKLLSKDKPIEEYQKFGLEVLW